MDDLEAGTGGGGSGGGSSLPRLPLSLLLSSRGGGGGGVPELPRLRILWLGDHGVGKSALVQRLAGPNRSVEEVARNMDATTGCATECKLYQYTGTAGPIFAPAAAATNHATNNSHFQQHPYGSSGGGSVAQLHSGSLLQHRVTGSLSHSSLLPSALTGGGSATSSASASSPSSSSSPVVWLEMWDVSGHRKFELSRSLFYRDIHALVLVFDLMNRKSYENVRRWIKEIVRADREQGGVEERGISDDEEEEQMRRRRTLHAAAGPSSPQQQSSSSPALRPTPSPLLGPSSPASLGSSPGAELSSSSSQHLISALGQLPILLIGNKSDEYRSRAEQQGSYDSLHDYGLECIHLSARDPREDFARLDKFFDRVVARRLQQRHQHRQQRRTTTTRNATARADSSNGGAYAAGAASSYYAASASAGYGHAAPAYAASASASPHAVDSRHYSGAATNGATPLSLQLPPSSSRSNDNGGSYSVGGFVPPPIRSFADFTGDSAVTVGGGGGGSGSSSGGASPSAVIGPSGLDDDGYDNAHFAPHGFGRSTQILQQRDQHHHQQQQHQQQPYASFLPASSLPTNTALHALTQQRQRF
jgi:GTPase SAR1 family protein